MKILFIILAFLSSCGDKNNKKQETSDSEKYLVTKIDNVNGYHIIDLKKEDYFYRILSKSTSSECNKIMVNKEYQFSLSSIWHGEITLADGRVVKSPLQVNCKSFEGVGEICLEDNPKFVKDLFKADNLEGLCLKK